MRSYDNNYINKYFLIEKFLKGAIYLIGNGSALDFMIKFYQFHCVLQ